MFVHQLYTYVSGSGRRPLDRGRRKVLVRRRFRKTFPSRSGSSARFFGKQFSSSSRFAPTAEVRGARTKSWTNYRPFIMLMAPMLRSERAAQTANSAEKYFQLRVAKMCSRHRFHSDSSHTSRLCSCRLCSIFPDAVVRFSPEIIPNHRHI